MSTQLVGKRSNQHQSRIYADEPENSYSAYDHFAAKIRKMSEVSGDTIEISAAVEKENESGQNSQNLKQRVLDIIKVMIDEFNCNHQADLDSPDLVKIYERDDEHNQIREFLKNGIKTGKSGLMYLCGHPGTGKTSSLNLVLA